MHDTLANSQLLKEAVQSLLPHEVDALERFFGEISTFPGLGFEDVTGTRHSAVRIKLTTRRHVGVDPNHALVGLELERALRSLHFWVDYGPHHLPGELDRSLRTLLRSEDRTRHPFFSSNVAVQAQQAIQVLVLAQSFCPKP